MDPWLRDRLAGSGDRGNVYRRRTVGVGRAAPTITRRQRRDVDELLRGLGREVRARRVRRALWWSVGVTVLVVGAAGLAVGLGVV